MMASAQVVETSVNANNSPSQYYTTNPDDHSNHNIDSPGFKPFTVIEIYPLDKVIHSSYNRAQMHSQANSSRVDGGKVSNYSLQHILQQYFEINLPPARIYW